ncbi:MAG: hypothetical protein FJ112_07935, partial [Deltaproteobacteria bacterium]|nr:hypothetical protein [Deltaproteobacteria bacterium]
MGLAERRALNNFQTNEYKTLENTIHAAAGFKVKVTVDWEKLGTDGNSDLYKDGFTKVYFTPLIEAFKAICIDEMGRKALKAELKEIVITNSADLYSPQSWTLEKGVLTLDH